MCSSDLERLVVFLHSFHRQARHHRLKRKGLDSEKLRKYRREMAVRSRNGRKTSHSTGKKILQQIRNEAILSNRFLTWVESFVQGNGSFHALSSHELHMPHTSFRQFFLIACRTESQSESSKRNAISDFL